MRPCPKAQQNASARHRSQCTFFQPACTVGDHGMEAIAFMHQIRSASGHEQPTWKPGASTATPQSNRSRRLLHPQLHHAQRVLLQVPLAQSRVAVRAPAGWPVKPAIRSADRQIVNAGKAAVHQTLRVECPVFVAVTAKPTPRIVVPPIGKTHGNPLTGESESAFAKDLNFHPAP